MGRDVAISILFFLAFDIRAATWTTGRIEKGQLQIDYSTCRKSSKNKFEQLTKPICKNESLISPNIYILMGDMRTQ